MSIGSRGEGAEGEDVDGQQWRILKGGRSNWGVGAEGLGEDVDREQGGGDVVDI